ncbi:hypothetical protein SH528x_000126 [Novipirellula sp. SH528]|uniref:hypothetical protein n=1 Tax=Novipirellula sp. SH528 TaxID=3454466 RepID=UPI003F9F656F
MKNATPTFQIPKGDLLSVSTNVEVWVQCSGIRQNSSPSTKSGAIHYPKSKVRGSTGGLFRCLLLVGAVLLPGIMPCIGLQWSLAECEAPLDAAESSEEAVVRTQGHTPLRRSQPESRHLVVAYRRATFRVVSDMDRTAPSGHRLANHLMAPLLL